MSKGDRKQSAGGDAEPPKKKRERVSPIPGLELLKAADLHLDFKKFRHDDLFFITHCTYVPPAPERPIQRAAAVTPAAFFVCDLNGKMDRATRLEQFSQAIVQKVVSKKFLSTVTHYHYVLKIPTEFDIYIIIEEDKKNPEHARLLATTMEKVIAFRAPGQFTVEELGPDDKIADRYKTERPQGFLSPQEILRQNQQRQFAIDKTQEANTETVALVAERDALKKDVEEKAAQLRALEAAMGVDLADLHKKKDEVSHLHVSLHREHTSVSIEVAKIEAENNVLKDRLREERSKFDDLVQEGVDSAGTDMSSKQNELHTLRKKAQQREIAAATAKYDAMKAKAKTVPAYTCAEALAARAEKLEAEIDNVMSKLEREFSNTDKMIKFFETLNAELERVGNTAAEKNAEKQRLLEERRARESAAAAAATAAAAAATVAPVAGLGLDDDDLLGGGEKPTPSAGGPGGLLDDDDLLGGEPAPPASASAAVDIDDLGLESPKPAPAATNAAPLDDLDLGGDDNALGSAPAPPAGAPADDDGLL